MLFRSLLMCGVIYKSLNIMNDNIVVFDTRKVRESLLLISRNALRGIRHEGYHSLENRKIVRKRINELKRVQLGKNVSKFNRELIRTPGRVYEELNFRNMNPSKECNHRYSQSQISLSSHLLKMNTLGTRSILYQI